MLMVVVPADAQDAADSAGFNVKETPVTAPEVKPDKLPVNLPVAGLAGVVPVTARLANTDATSCALASLIEV